MATLILLGTVHRDPQGLTRLANDLAMLKPHVITLEFSRYGLTYRRRRKKIFTKKLLQGLQKIRETETLRIADLKGLLRSSGIGGIAALIDLPFEYKGARCYSRCNGLPLYLLDLSSSSRRFLSHIDELLSPKNLKKVITFEAAPLQETVRSEYKNAEKLLFTEGQSPWLKLFPTDENWQKRERCMAGRIRKIVAKHQGHHIVHISGWQHLLSRKGTLFNLLEDLMPQRILLNCPLRFLEK